VPRDVSIIRFSLRERPGEGLLGRLSLWERPGVARSPLPLGEAGRRPGEGAPRNVCGMPRWIPEANAIA